MRIAAVVAAVVVGVLAADAHAGAHATRACPSAGQTIASSAEVRVFKRPSSGSGFAYACLRKTGRTVHIGNIGGVPGYTGEALYAVRTVGVYVVYDSLSCDYGACDGGIRVRNLATGVVHREGKLRNGDHEVTDDVLTGRGNAAWIRKRIINGETFYAVRTLASRDRVRRRAFGSDIDPNSLRYDRRTHHASWLEGQTRRVVALR